MTEVSDQSVESATTQRFCGECGKPTPVGPGFCGECGAPIAGQSNGAPSGVPRASARQTVIEAQDGPRTPLVPPVTPPPNYAATPPSAAPMPPGPPYAPPPNAYGYPTGSYAGPPPPPDSSHTALFVSLVIAAVLALGAAVAVALLASGGNGRVVTVSNASSGVSSGSSAGPTTSGSPTGQGQTAAPPAATRPPSGAGSASGSPSAAVQRHWQLIGQGDYEGAFALISPSYQNSVGGHDTWVGDKKRDRPTVSSLSVGPATINSPTNATVPLTSLHTVGQESPQCHNWSGSYDMTKVNGSWLINQTNLSSTTC